LQIGDTTVSTANKITLGKTATTSEAILPTIYAGSYISAGAGVDAVIETGSTSAGIVFRTGNPAATRAVIDSAGNLGLAVTPSAWNSSYKAIQTNTQGSLAASATGAMYLGNNWFQNSSAQNTYITTNAAGLAGWEGNIFKWYQAASGTANSTITFTQAMTLDASGNLGLAVTPSAGYGALQVTTGTNGTAATLGNGAGVHAYNGAGYFSSSVTLSSAGTWTARQTGAAIVAPTNSGTILFYTDTGLTSGNTFSPTPRMTLDASGNLGIGTSSPAQILHISGGSIRPTFQSTANGQYCSSRWLGKNSSGGNVQYEYGVGIAANDAWELYDIANAGLVDRYISGASGYRAFCTNNTERVRIDASGNTMINCGGATGAVYDTNGGADVSFAYRLQSSNGSAYGRSVMGNNNTTDVGLYATTCYNTSGNQILTTVIRGVAGSRTAGSETGYFDFCTKPSGASAYSNQRMRIDNSSVFINTSATYQTNAQLQILGGGGIDQAPIGLKNSSNATTWQMGPDSNGNFLVFRANVGSGVYVTTTGTSWTGTSDERLKTDLVPIEDGLSKVMSLRSVTGRFKSDEVGTSRAFLIAQDVQAVLPEAVDASNPDKLGLAYTDVIPLLVASIKELAAEVAELKAKVA
jgi:hypothetical protein